MVLEAILPLQPKSQKQLFLANVEMDMLQTKKLVIQVPMMVAQPVSSRIQGILARVETGLLLQLVSSSTTAIALLLNK